MVERLSPVTYELSLSDPAGGDWQVTRVAVDEALNRPYRAIIDVRSDADDPDADALLGCDACLSLSRSEAGARLVCGVVTRVDFLGEQHHHALARLHVVPAFELLRQRVSSRIWQHQSVIDIVSEVLGEALGGYGRSFAKLGLSRGARIRDYCVQYRESDLAFVSRLLEEEGISYEFVHDGDQRLEILTLRDDNRQYRPLENIDGSSELPIIASNPGEADVESIQSFEWSRQLTSTAALRRDYDWKTPRHLLSASAAGADERDRERRVFAHGGRRYREDDLGERATDLQLAAALESRVVRGASNATALRPGLRFTLRGHYRLDLEQEYLVTEVEHAGAEAHTSEAGAAEAYSNRFRCVPIDALVRPEQRTPKPREHGPQTAIVTGPPGEEIHTDEHGRVQVQFYWQEHPSYAAESSCWVRCSQSWSGQGFGAQFIPRVGMEVVVEFLEGDPDRPLVTGCVYNAEYPHPFALPEHKTQSGWRTESSPGGGGSNELRFEDAAGIEEIFLHGERDWTIRIEHDKDQLVGNDERLEVRHDRRKKVGNDEEFEIGHDQIGRVQHDQELRVAHDQRVTIGANQAETVGESKSVRVGASFDLDVGDSMTTKIANDSTTSVGKQLSLTVGEDASESISGDKAVSATNSTTRTSEDTSFATGKKFLVDAEDEVGVKSETTMIFEAGKKIVFKCGDASITLKQDGKILIKGKDVTVKGSGNVVIKGQKLAGN